MLKFKIMFVRIKDGRKIVDRQIIPADHIDEAVDKVKRIYEVVQIISAEKFKF